MNLRVPVPFHHERYHDFPHQRPLDDRAQLGALGQTLRSEGYNVIAANWPGMEGDIEQLRRDPSGFASLGLRDVVDHYEQIIRRLETPPVIIGHGFGG